MAAATENIFNPGMFTSFNPFTAWVDMAMKTTEMMVSSGQVIGDRVDGLTRAAANQTAGAQKEMVLSTGGPLKAVSDSTMDVATRLQNTGLQMISRAWQQWFEALGAMMTMTGSNSFGEMLQRQDRLFKSLARPNRTQSQMSSEDDAEDAPHRPAGRAKPKSANAKRQTRVSRTRVSAKRRSS